MVQLFTKEELIEKITSISKQGWIKSVKKPGNDGAVGNTLEILLGIDENNLPVPNAAEWELKGQRASTSSLTTLFHLEPSPQAAKIVSEILLPKYGWPHKKAGQEHPETEMSFRSTTYGNGYTIRGFKVDVDRNDRKIKIDFSSSMADQSKPEIAEWIQSVRQKVGLSQLNPQPYWGFDDLNYKAGSKLRNCFYVIAENKKDDKNEYFHYSSLLVLTGFSFENFLKCIEAGKIVIDFDARTGHNHGTKFRIKQNNWPELYSTVKKAF
jgi:hypothetical protein